MQGFTPATADTLAPLRETLDARAFPETTDAYLSEPRGSYRGEGLVVAPADTDAVARTLAFCHAHRIAVVPYGGGTGLVGGQLTPGAPLILSLERLSAVRARYPSENVLVVEAGAILSDVQAEAEAMGRLFPLSLASEGSARIGGLLATNAGGVNVLRYGSMRSQCLGLEVVRADGTVWNGLSRLRKDNTGYDLRDLFIGSEGTLGVITAAALRVMPRPEGVGAAMLAVPSPAAALDLLSLAQDRVGEGVSAFEIIHRQGFDFLEETGLAHRRPFPQLPDWTVLIDLGLSGGADPQAALEGLFADALERELVTDGVLAQSLGDRQAFWDARETIPEANRRIGAIASHDISLPLSAVPEFVATAPDRLAEIAEVRINCFGHLGDGNLHYNAFPVAGRDREAYRDVKPAITACIHDLVHALDGSISAEHGIGRLKVADLETYADPVKLETMRAIKSALDPRGILNPGAILRSR